MHIDTPFGPLTCTAGPALAEHFVVVVAPLASRHRSRPAVTGCLAIVWQVSAEHALASGVVTCEWVHAWAPGTPASGEGLEAIEWESGACAIALGTEDIAALRARLGLTLPAHYAETLDADSTITYGDAGFRVTVAPMQAGDVASGHFILAWTDRADAVGAWLEVDRPHAALRTVLEPPADAVC